MASSASSALRRALPVLARQAATGAPACARPLATHAGTAARATASAAPALPAARLSRAFATRAEIAARSKGAGTAFPLLVDALFSRVEAGIIEGGMLTKNEGMAVRRTGGGATGAPAALHIDMAGAPSTFVLEAEAATSRISLLSPKMGQGRGSLIYYVYKATTEAWVGAEDGHFLLELLTRDLIYVAKGYPVL
jgi:hypothetical protein